MDLSRVIKKDTPGNQIEYGDKNEKIYKSIFTFKKGVPTEKKIADLFKRRVICRKIKSATDVTY